MIRVYCAGRSACEPPVELSNWVLPPDAVWIDLVKPNIEEEAAVEKALGLSVPTREEMAELEASSRVYRENGATYATADIITHGDEEIPGVEPVTFVVTDGPLVTIRYVDPKPFALMVEKLHREPRLCATGTDIFLHLMETVIDRASDILSGTVVRVEGIAGHVFSGGRTVGFGKLITKLGRAQMTNARIEQSLAGLTRIFAFVGIDERMSKGEARAHLRSLSRDAESLSAHNHTIAASINFQLSAALGLINIEQSSIIKIFSVAAVALLPPTLIASIYGMNFDFMPELSKPWGYPAALTAMVVSVMLPLAWFKRKGWL
ncbi:MAG: magnesium transporter CorA family protein [Brevundimonas sp.]|uniref:magnesium transporter CorA family protein n=1 Tax=Brevundimonas sp. TaxID=1871086 RepID=UPI0024895A3D|nr:magnesium transporter CorA family protein [Brevundimonas sp.]MDI1327996.1 magnesium transporter CorA family protein [Brevundimonas sp.]